MQRNILRKRKLQREKGFQRLLGREGSLKTFTIYFSKHAYEKMIPGQGKKHCKGVGR